MAKIWLKMEHSNWLKRSTYHIRGVANFIYTKHTLEHLRKWKTAVSFTWVRQRTLYGMNVFVRTYVFECVSYVFPSTVYFTFNLYSSGLCTDFQTIRYFVAFVSFIRRSIRAFIYSISHHKIYFATDWGAITKGYTRAKSIVKLYVMFR